MVVVGGGRGCYDGSYGGGGSYGGAVTGAGIDFLKASYPEIKIITRPKWGDDMWGDDDDDYGYWLWFRAGESSRRRARGGGVLDVFQSLGRTRVQQQSLPSRI